MLQLFTTFLLATASAFILTLIVMLFAVAMAYLIMNAIKDIRRQVRPETLATLDNTEVDSVLIADYQQLHGTLRMYKKSLQVQVGLLDSEMRAIKFESDEFNNELYTRYKTLEATLEDFDDTFSSWLD